LEVFLCDVTNLLLSSIKDNQNIEITEIALPNLNADFEKYLLGNSIYDSYLKSYSGENLSDYVLRKFLSRLFIKDANNSEMHIIYAHLQTWLERKLALCIVQDSRFNNLSILKSLINKTELMRNFCFYLFENIPIKWIQENEQDWVDVNANPENIIDSIERHDKDYFDNYISSLEKQPKDNIWNFTEEATRNSDYMMLNREFRFKSSALIKKTQSLWIIFWDNLQLPIIQDCMFYDLKPEQYLDLISKLTSGKEKIKSDVKILLLIVAKNYFEASYRLTERLSIYEETERVKPENEHFFQEGQKYYKEWLEETKKNYEFIIKNLQKKLSNADIADLVFSYKPIVNIYHSKSN